LSFSKSSAESSFPSDTATFASTRPGERIPEMTVETAGCDSHLHEFRVGQENYGDPMPDADWHPDHNEHRTKLAQVLAKPKAQMTYVYDFGDSWEHRIELEQILPLEVGKTYPVCIAGKRNCPPENCGGLWGYQNMLEILKDPEHEEYENTLTWLGGQFDAEHFDLKRINDRLRS
jgi:Plasmid pRiA4b ORF-3-like protein